MYWKKPGQMPTTNRGLKGFQRKLGKPRSSPECFTIFKGISGNLKLGQNKNRAE